MSDPIHLLFLAGAIGSLVRLLVEDGKVILPCRVSGGFALGFFGSMIVGGFVGIVIDGSLIGAGMSGYIGASLLDRVYPNVTSTKINEEGEC